MKFGTRTNEASVVVQKLRRKQNNLSEIAVRNVYCSGKRILLVCMCLSRTNASLSTHKKHTWKERREHSGSTKQRIVKVRMMPLFADSRVAALDLPMILASFARLDIDHVDLRRCVSVP
eukprot:5455456-Amphidinium_carterae.1